MEQKELTLDKRKALLEELGFEEKDKGKWVKSVEGGWAYWDFRNPKFKNGRFFVAIDGGNFMDNDQAKELSEYIEFRKATGGTVESKKPVKKDAESKPIEKDEAKIVNLSKEDSIVLRGNENNIADVVKARRLDVIAKIAKDGKGEGVLYHDLGAKIGLEPSADLIELICNDMGGIETKLIEHKIRHHIDIATGEDYQTVYAVVESKDTITGTISFGVATEVMDFEEMKKTGRSFAFTKACRKAKRNSQERLLNVPRRALCQLVIDLIDEHKKTKQK